MSDSVTKQSELISQFSNVTGIEPDRAKFYLESAAWNLQVALASFYEDDGDIAEQIASVAQSNEYPTQTSSSGSTPSAQPRQGFATVASLRHDDSSNEEEGQAFYAGGSERSGQQVLGPGKKNDLISEMFKSAKAHGAEVIKPSDEASTSKKGTNAFRGTGYRLGASADDSTVVAGSSSSSSQFETPETSEIVLKMWQNGFSVDNGPLRDYHDPANQGFLESIRRGEIPAEFLRNSMGSEISLNMEDHRHEDFIAPKTKTKVFSGTGHMLGSPAPSVIVNSTPKVTPNDSGDKMVKVDEAQPVTNVQIRLADGTRLVARLNEEHTVRDLYSFVSSSRPQYSCVPFVLMTTFPNMELNDQDVTLKQASLLNAVIVQRLK